MTTAGTPTVTDGHQDTEQSIAVLIAIASRLVELIDRETALLREMRPGAIRELQEDKTRLVRAYLERAEELRRDSTRLQSVRSAVRDELRETIGRFEDAAAANVLALRAAREANSRLLQAVVDAVAENRAATYAYSRDGALSSVNEAGAGALSLTLDKQL